MRVGNHILCAVMLSEITPDISATYCKDHALVTTSSRGEGCFRKGPQLSLT